LKCRSFIGDIEGDNDGVLQSTRDS
jgi:hypothetical protein